MERYTPKNKKISVSRVLGWILSSVILLGVMAGGLYFNDAIHTSLLEGLSLPDEARSRTVVQVSPTPPVLSRAAAAPADTAVPPGDPVPTSTPEPTAAPSPTPAIHPMEGGVLKEGMSAPVAVDIQIRLMVLEYMDFDQPGEEYGTGAAQAMASFQRRNGLPATGECDQATYEKLYAQDARPFALEMGDTGDEVQTLQERLEELGYLDAAPNGVYDDATAQAVARFCKKNGLTVSQDMDADAYEVLLGDSPVQNSYQRGEVSEQIRTFQQRLLELGYLTYRVDGKYGDLTVQAVKRFQDSCGLVADGCLTTTTVQKLMEEEAPAFRFEKGMSGADVKQIQKLLCKLGYLSSKEISGKYDAKTIAAVKNFHQRNGLSADGAAGAKTLAALLSGKAREAKATAKVTEKPANTPKPTAAAKPTAKATAKATAKPANTPKPTKTPKATKVPEDPGPTPEGEDVQTPEPGGQPETTPKTEQTPAPEATPQPEEEYGEGLEAFISAAKSKLGSKYVRGAKGPDKFDCSGFVYWCLKQAGVKVGYMTSVRWRTCDKFERVMDMKDLKRGDVLVFSGKSASSGHVGIYMGGGKMIDAGSSAGKVVIRDSIHTDYWEGHFLMGYHIWD